MMSPSDCTTYLDESGGQPYFVVGGLTSIESHWGALAEQWASVLANPPAIPFFKFSNPHGLSAVDHGTKIDALIQIINQRVLRADACIIDVGEYEIYLKNLIGVSYETPMHFGYIQALQQCAREYPKKYGRISFVFDTMSNLQLADLQHAFQVFRESCPAPEVKARLDQEPKCLDDKDVPQLQAADLWAGLVNASVRGDAAAVDYLRKVAIPNRAFLWDQSRLAEILSRTIRRTPDITSGKYYETRKRRKIRLKSQLAKLKDS